MHKPNRLNLPVLYLESIGVNLQHKEGALASLSKNPLANKHLWGYSLPVFKSNTEMVYVCASFGKDSASSFHLHNNFRQTVYSIEGELLIQNKTGIYSVQPASPDNAPDVPLKGAAGVMSFESLTLGAGGPHRLAFFEPCLFVETYTTTSMDETLLACATVGNVFYKDSEGPRDPDITRLTKGAKENFKMDLERDSRVFEEYLELTT